MVPSHMAQTQGSKPYKTHTYIDQFDIDHLYLIPLCNHFLHGLLQGVLLGSGLTDGLKLLQVGLQVQLNVLGHVGVLSVGVHMGVGRGRGGGSDQINQMCDTILPLVDSLCMLLKTIFLDVMA